MYSAVPHGLRPLMLSNTNKVVARAVDHPLAAVAENAVHPMQRGFMRGRQIIDNMVEAEAMLVEYALLGRDA